MKKRICEVIGEKVNINGEEIIIKDIVHDYDDWQDNLSDYSIQRKNKKISNKNLHKGICNRFETCDECCHCDSW